MKQGLWLALLLASFTAQAAEMYRWVDLRGVTNYADQPPRIQVRQAQRLIPQSTPAQAPTPQPASPATDARTVELFSTDCGPVCDRAKGWLTERGIAYALKDPTREPRFAAELVGLTKSHEVPVLRVGSQHFKGFEPTAWGRLLIGTEPNPAKPNEKTN